MPRINKPPKTSSPLNALAGVIAAALMLLSLSACETPLKPTPRPVVVEPVKLTPLPTSVLSIDSESSQSYLQKARAWLERVAESLKGETPK